LSPKRKILKTFLFLLFFPFIFMALALVFAIRTLERWRDSEFAVDEFD
jgi:hypothetical protein